VRKLPQAEVDEGCMAAYRRYKAMPIREARLMFAYDVQGFVKLTVEDHGVSLDTVRQRTNELFDLLAKANPQ
jgi:hypothetical protein